MKSIRNVLTATLLAAAAVLTAATGVSVATAAEEATATPPPPPPGPHGWHHGGPWHLLSKLDLTAAQKAQIKGIMTTARPEMQSLREQMRANSLKLEQTKPTDANYASIAAAVSQTHGSLSAQMMSQHSDIRAQIFKVLTPAQQAQLATLEAERQAQREAHGHTPNP